MPTLTLIYKRCILIAQHNGQRDTPFYFISSPSNIFPRRNDGNSIYTYLILMGCLRNKDLHHIRICFLKFNTTFTTLTLNSFVHKFIFFINLDVDRVQIPLPSVKTHFCCVPHTPQAIHTLC